MAYTEHNCVTGGLQPYCNLLHEVRMEEARTGITSGFLDAPLMTPAGSVAIYEGFGISAVPLPTFVLIEGRP